MQGKKILPGKVSLSCMDWPFIIFELCTGGEYMSEYKSERNWINNDPLTIVDLGSLHFCLEYRSVEIYGCEIGLTAKEFDIFALLILNPRRVFTYEMIMDVVWNEPYNAYSRKTIINHISNIRKKLKVSSEIPDYIKSVHSIGYKFETNASV